MSYETEVAALTVAVNTVSSLVTTLDTTTKSAYNVAVATAQTHAGTALNHANTAATQVGLATTQASTATTQAGIATTQASTATTQAGIATTQASAATAAAVGASNIVLGVSTLYPNIRPTLDLDFANGQTVDPRITFTRASTATRTNARGLIEAVASGVPRIDFDAVTGACKGLRIEEQRANLLTYSEAFDNAVWNKTQSSVLSNAATAPDGTMTAEKIVENTALAEHTVNRLAAVSVTANTPHTVSVYAKAGERSRLYVTLAVGNYSSNVKYDFNLTTGTNGSATLSGSASGASATITPVGDGWFRCSVTGLLDAASVTINHNFSTHDGSTNFYTGDGTSGLFIWGAQLEAGAFLTSYIPTVASQVTRAADVASMTGANFSSWYRQDEGSFVAIASADFDSSTSLFPTHLSVNDGTLLNRIVLGQRTIDDTAIGTIVNGGATQVDFSATSSAVYGTQNNIALAYKVNDAAIARSGVLSQTDASLTVPTVNQMGIGVNAGTSALNGHIRSISYYPKRLTNAELQALSTQ